MWDKKDMTINSPNIITFLLSLSTGFGSFQGSLSHQATFRVRKTHVEKTHSRVGLSAQSLWTQDRRIPTRRLVSQCLVSFDRIRRGARDMKISPMWELFCSSPWELAMWRRRQKWKVSPNAGVIQHGVHLLLLVFFIHLVCWAPVFWHSNVSSQGLQTSDSYHFHGWDSAKSSVRVAITLTSTSRSTHLSRARNPITPARPTDSFAGSKRLTCWPSLRWWKRY